MGFRRPLGPVGWLLFAFAGALVLSYVGANCRGIRAAEEATSSGRAMISLAAWCGLTLAVGAGLTSMRQLTTVLRILAGGATVVALLGILQFTVGLDIARLVSLPGLTANHPVGAVIERANFRRVTGTANHPIEFGVVLSALLPLLVHFARFSTQVWARRRWWAAAATVAAALPLAIARSGILGAVVVSVVVLPTLPRSLRMRLLAALGVGVVAMSFLVPGLLGTLRGLVLNAASDPSTQGRQDDYAPLLHYISETPWLGRGPGTFVPGVYRTLDNQYLGTAVETGVVGLAALLALLLGSVVAVLMVRRRTADLRVRSVSVSLAAGILAFAVNAATFDLFGFAMAVGVLFVLIGAVGALTRLVPVRGRPAGSRSPERGVLQGPGRPPVRTALGLLAVGAFALPVAVGAVLVAQAAPTHLAVVSFVVEPPLPGGPSGDVRASANASGAASVLHDILEGPAVQDTLARAGVRDPAVAIGEGSLMWGTDINGYGPALSIAIQAPTAAAAAAGEQLALDLAVRELADLQARVGIPTGRQLRIDDIVARAPYAVEPHRPLAVATLLILTGVMTAGAWSVLRRGRPMTGPSWPVVAPGHAVVVAGSW